MNSRGPPKQKKAHCLDGGWAAGWDIFANSTLTLYHSLPSPATEHAL